MHVVEEGEGLEGTPTLDEAGDGGRPCDDVSQGHLVEQMEGQGRLAAALEVHVKEVVLEEEGGMEEGALEELGVDGSAEAEVGGLGTSLQEMGVALVFLLVVRRQA